MLSRKHPMRGAPSYVHASSCIHVFFCSTKPLHQSAKNAYPLISCRLAIPHCTKIWLDWCFFLLPLLYCINMKRECSKFGKQIVTCPLLFGSATWCIPFSLGVYRCDVRFYVLILCYTFSKLFITHPKAEPCSLAASLLFYTMGGNAGSKDSGKSKAEKKQDKAERKKAKAQKKTPPQDAGRAMGAAVQGLSHYSLKQCWSWQALRVPKPTWLQFPPMKMVRV